jgi:hypothetical protein
MQEKLQAATDDSNAVAHTERKHEVLLSGNRVCLPSPPEAWVAPVPKTVKGEPAFAEVDNPGKWCEYTYHAKFGKNGGVQGSYCPYSCHASAPK